MSPLTLIALLLTTGGIYLLNTGRYPWDGGLLLTLGLAGLARAFWRHTHPPRLAPAPQRRLALPGRRATLRLLALLLSLGVAFQHPRLPYEADFSVVFGLWALACVAFIVSLLPPFPWRKIEPRRLTCGDALLPALLLLALLTRVISLERVPPIFSGDEGEMARAAYMLLTPPLDNPFRTGWLGNPTMTFLVLGLGERLLGTTIAGARIISALVGTAAVFTTFLLGRALGGQRVGWISALVMACWAYAIHYSRLAINNIADAFLAPLAFWSLWQALARDARRDAAALRWWGLAGFAAGLGWYGYFGARWLTAMLGLFVAWRALREPGFWERQKRGLLTLGVGWLVAAAPILYWFALHPNDLISRYHQVSLFASGWFADTVALTGQSPALVMLHYFFKALGGFHAVPDPTFWYHPGVPLLDFIWGTLMAVGMVESIIRWRWPSRGLTLLWFWSTLITAWVLTENPPSSQRGVLLMPVVALLIAWGTEALLELGRERTELRAALYVALAAAAFFNLIFYFVLYTPRRVYGNPTAEIATEVARYQQAHPLPAGAKVYFMGEPYLYWEFGTLAYLLRDVPGENVPLETVPELDTHPARLVLIAPRAREWNAISSAYPTGTLTPLFAPGTGNLLALIYDVP